MCVVVVFRGGGGGGEWWPQRENRKGEKNMEMGVGGVMLFDLLIFFFVW